MTGRAFKTLMVTASFIAVAAVAFALPTAPSTEGASEAPLALTVAYPETLQACLFCSDGCAEENAHAAIESSDPDADNEEGVGAHSCFTTGDCDFHHPSGCAVDDDAETLAALEGVRLAIGRGDADAVFSLVESTPQLSYVAARNAVQAYGGCQQSLVAHVPLASLVTND